MHQTQNEQGVRNLRSRERKTQTQRVRLTF